MINSDFHTQTDFVAQNSDFVAVAQTLLDLALAEAVDSKEDLLTKSNQSESMAV